MKNKNENVQLEGANPSAEEGEDAGGEGESVMVHDIEDQFRLVWLKTEEGLKPSKDAYKSHLKSMFSVLWRGFLVSFFNLGETQLGASVLIWRF